jgi:leucyl/phenylalanyl-tRNA---protein transferase
MFEISAEDIIKGYSQGIFPMADPDDKQIYWYSPNPRAIIPMETYRCAKSLRSVINKNVFDLKINHDFIAIIENCALPRNEEDGVWISDDIMALYIQLHSMGYAHSVEVYHHGKLAGGLYGVAMGSVFFGESMFYNIPNASKVAFHFLVERLIKRNFVLLDTQFINDNVKRFGAIEVPKDFFLSKLKYALAIPNTFV